MATTDMISERRERDFVAVAWAIAWALCSLGFVLADTISDPNQSLTVTCALGLLGWAIGAAATVRHLQRKSHVAAPSKTVAVVGWTVGALVGVVVGQMWLRSWDAGFLGPIVSAAIGGAIGGGLTDPIHSGSNRVARAVNWGMWFLVLQVVAFYGGYILMQMTVDPLVPIVGHTAAKIPGWAVPAALSGWAAGRMAVRSVQVAETRRPDSEPVVG